ncbi:MAG: hypothetical protein F4X17_10915 [Gemmatimonadetes bacterium]|nr:hypothetical protein [Gemmatimonadota bacterium]MYI64153.1 hypothetical protein [Gemmatimonadota bacterium]
MAIQSDNSQMESILYELRVLLLEVTEMDIDPDLVDLDEALLDGNLGMDSAEILTYVQEIEERFGFEFDDDDLNPEVLSSLRSLTEFVSRAISV